MPSDNSRFHLTIGSRFENIELVQVVLHDALERARVGDEHVQWVDLAVREAVANAILHGNRKDPDKQVEIDVTLTGGELTVRVLDEGEGFEPQQVADPLDPANLLNPNGRGIFYMRQFMDQIDYAYRPEGGTVVTLKKRLEPPPGISEAESDSGGDSA
jgi:serine/threonine-protein kinase RsbW